MKMLFDGLQFVAEFDAGFSFKKKKEVRDAIIKNGGILSYLLNRKTDYLLLSNPEKIESFKCRSAIQKGVPVVNVDFIFKCIEESLVIDAKRCEVVSESNKKAFQKGKISETKKRRSAGQKRTILPSNVKFWARDDLNAPFFDEPASKLIKWAVYERESNAVKSCLVIEVAVCLQRDDPKNYRILVNSGTNFSQKREKDEFFVSGDSEETVATFAGLCQQTGHNRWNKSTSLPPAHLGSVKLHAILSSFLPDQSPDESVLQLVYAMWEESMGQLLRRITKPLNEFDLDMVEEIEGILLQMKSSIQTRSPPSEMESLLNDLVEKLTLREKPSKVTLSEIASFQNLCQLIRDLICVQEANGGQPTTPIAKYTALGCRIGHVSEGSSEYEEVLERIKTSNSNASAISVRNIFRIQRCIEDEQFNTAVGNNTTLFHASNVKNFVGILSRGLLLPKVVVDDLGGLRTDAGLLGTGIYFAKDAMVSAKYSSPSETQGTRLMLVTEVALGRSKPTTKSDTTITDPPVGFESYHGVKATTETPSDFKDDEYAVYHVNQQRLRYIIEFTLPADKPKLPLALPASPMVQTPAAPVTVPMDASIDDMDCTETTTTPAAKAGLFSGGEMIPLRAVHVRARVVDLAVAVTLWQCFQNNSSQPIECRYVFPLDDNSVVVGFEALINGKRVVGRVREKKQARTEYREAIEAGHGAYLLEQESPSALSLSVGSLPVGAVCVIRVEIVAELATEGDELVWSLPGSVAPWEEESMLRAKRQAMTGTVAVAGARFGVESSLRVSVQMPTPLRRVECTTHRVRKKETECNAVVELAHDQALDGRGFRLSILLAEVHAPRMWVEQGQPGEPQGCMVTFYPEFECDKSDDFECVIMIDASHSMKGQAFNDAQRVAMMVLKRFPVDAFFNVVLFGKGWKELFPSAVRATEENRLNAANFIKSASPTLGSSELSQPLFASSCMASPRGGLQNVVVLSDGHLLQPEQVIHVSQLASRRSLRLFTCGVGPVANRHMLRNVARHGGGMFEMFDPSVKSKWTDKVESMLDCFGQPSLADVRVDWQVFSEEKREAMVQAPQLLPSLFHGQRQVVYGMVDDCRMATLRASADGTELSTVVSTYDMAVTTGRMLHQLGAKAIIRDWEEGVLHARRTQHEVEKRTRKAAIIDLSVKYSIVTQFTSFIAVEERKPGEVISENPNVDDLVMENDVDCLPYMAWVEPLRDVAHEEKQVEPLRDTKGLMGDNEFHLDDDVYDELFVDDSCALDCSFRADSVEMDSDDDDNDKDMKYRFMKKGGGGGDNWNEDEECDDECEADGFLGGEWDDDMLAKLVPDPESAQAHMSYLGERLDAQEIEELEELQLTSTQLMRSAGEMIVTGTKSDESKKEKKKMKKKEKTEEKEKESAGRSGSVEADGASMPLWRKDSHTRGEQLFEAERSSKAREGARVMFKPVPLSMRRSELLSLGAARAPPPPPVSRGGRASPPRTPRVGQVSSNLAAMLDVDCNQMLSSVGDRSRGIKQAGKEYHMQEYDFDQAMSLGSLQPEMAELDSPVATMATGKSFAMDAAGAATRDASISPPASASRRPAVQSWGSTRSSFPAQSQPPQPPRPPPPPPTFSATRSAPAPTASPAPGGAAGRGWLSSPRTASRGQAQMSNEGNAFVAASSMRDASPAPAKLASYQSAVAPVSESKPSAFAALSHPPPPPPPPMALVPYESTRRVYAAQSQPSPAPPPTLEDLFSLPAAAAPSASFGADRGVMFGAFYGSAQGQAQMNSGVTAFGASTSETRSIPPEFMTMSSSSASPSFGLFSGGGPLMAQPFAYRSEFNSPAQPSGGFGAPPPPPPPLPQPARTMEEAPRLEQSQTLDRRPSPERREMARKSSLKSAGAPPHVAHSAFLSAPFSARMQQQQQPQVQQQSMRPTDTFGTTAAMPTSLFQSSAAGSAFGPAGPAGSPSFQQTASLQSTSSLQFQPDALLRSISGAPPPPLPPRTKLLSPSQSPKAMKAAAPHEPPLERQSKIGLHRRDAPAARGRRLPEDMELLARRARAASSSESEESRSRSSGDQEYARPTASDLSADFLNELFGLLIRKNDECYWDLSAVTSARVNQLLPCFSKSLLLAAGVETMGGKAAADLCYCLDTEIVLIIMCLARGLLNPDDEARAKWKAEQLSDMTTRMQFYGECLSTFCPEATKQAILRMLTRVHRAHPLASQMLELGPSWASVAYSLVVDRKAYLAQMAVLFNFIPPATTTTTTSDDSADSSDSDDDEWD